MSKIKLNSELTVNKNVVYISSRVVAEKTGKEHKHILESINKICKDDKVVSSTLFIETKYKAKNGKMNREILLTKKGFLLYMFNIQGYNEFKLNYIEKFEEMEQILRDKQNVSWLHTRQNGKLVRRELTDIIQEFMEYSRLQGSKGYRFYYSNYSKMINKLLGLEKGQRDFVDYMTLNTISQLENLIMRIIEQGMDKGLDYTVIKENIKIEVKNAMRYLHKDVKFLDSDKFLEVK